MKKCTSCLVEKPIDGFSKDKHSKSGLSFKCKSCERIRSKSYKRTEQGLISVIFSNQKSNAEKRGRSSPNYSKIELSDWLYRNGFKELYDKWVLSGFDKDLVPSCDRESDYDDYTLYSLRLVTWKENNQKHYTDVVNGKNTKHTKPIIGVNLLCGDIVEYYSVSQASRELNISRAGISQNLTGNSNSSGGYIWNYKQQQ